MKSNVRNTMLLILLTALLISACTPAATPAPTTAPVADTAMPVADTAVPATEAPAAALPVEMWTYYGDTGPAGACVKTAGEDFNAAQSKYKLNIRNLAFTD